MVDHLSRPRLRELVGSRERLDCIILRAGHSFRFWENAIVLENHYATTG